MVFASVSTSDPDGDPLTVNWTFDPDPTGQAYFFNSTSGAFSKTLSGNFVGIGAGEPGPDPPNPSLQGKNFKVKVSVSDGVDTVVRTRQVSVIGLNEKPIVAVNAAGMGTRSNPKSPPQALSLTAGQSFNPDGALRFAWKLGAISGGFICPGKILVLFGKETSIPSVPLPLVTALPERPMEINFFYRIVDQMYILEESIPGYAASLTGCTEPGGEGSASGAVLGCRADNQPAGSELPATFVVAEKTRDSIRALLSADPDNTADPDAGLTFEWAVIHGQGMMSTEDLEGASTAAVSFTAPEVFSDTVINLQVFVSDPMGCGTVYPIDLVVLDSYQNSDPLAQLSYSLEGTTLSGQASGNPIELPSPARLHLDATGSSDPEDDTFEFDWQVETDFITGSAQFEITADGLATLDVDPSTQGTAAVTVLVSDGRGGSNSIDQLLIFPGPNPDPLRLIFPQIGDGGGLSTNLALMEQSSEAAQGTLQFYRSSGTLRSLTLDGIFDSQFPIQLAGDGSAHLQTGNDFFAEAGWAILEGFGHVEGVANYDYRVQGQLVTTVSVLAGPPTRGALLPIQNDETGTTGIAVANPGDEGVEFRLSARASAPGSPALEAMLDLGPRQHVSSFLPDLFAEEGIQLPEQYDGVLSVEMVSGGAISLTGLRQEGSVLSGIPVTLVDTAPGASNTIVPSEGDGNFDGIPDDEQPGVTTFLNSQTSSPVTVVTSEGSLGTLLNTSTPASLTGAAAAALPSTRGVAGVDNSVPSGFVLPAGFLEVTIEEVPEGGSVDVSVTLHSGIEIDTFFAFGPTPDLAQDHWYEFLYDGSTGALLGDHSLALRLVDGAQGDHDLTSNGSILVRGAPAVRLEEAIYSPQMGVGGGFSTSFTLLNPSDETAFVDMRFYKSDGTPHSVLLGDTLSSQTALEIQAGSSANLTISDDSPEVSAGWAFLESNRNLGAVVNFDLRGDLGDLLARVAVSGAPASRVFSLPVITDGPVLDTGIAVVNAGGAPISIRLKLYNEDGTLVASLIPAALENLQSLEHTASFITQLLPSVEGIEGFRGKLVMEAEGEGRISVVGLLLKEGLLAALPVVPAS